MDFIIYSSMSNSFLIYKYMIFKVYLTPISNWWWHSKIHTMKVKQRGEKTNRIEENIHRKQNGIKEESLLLHIWLINS